MLAGLEVIRDPKELARQRRDIAEAAFRGELFIQADPPPSGPPIRARRYDEVILWSERLAKAELDLAEGRDQRIAAAREEVRRAQVLLTLVDELLKGEATSFARHDRHEVDFYRAEAESRLAAELSNATPK